MEQGKQTSGGGGFLFGGAVGETETENGEQTKEGGGGKLPLMSQK